MTAESPEARESRIDTDFLLPSHHALAADVAAFAAEHVRPRIPEWESSGEINHDVVRTLARRGWISTLVPTEHGGPGLGHRDKLVILDHLSRVSGAIGAAAQASDIPLALFLHFTTPEQKQRWLPRLASGESLAAIDVTEPDAGGYVLGMDTSATRDGDHYILTGLKSFIGNSHIADLHTVIARTAENELSAFVVEADRPGLRLPPHPTTTGLRGFSFGDVEFDRVRVPAANRIGEDGHGLDAAHAASTVHGRLNIAAVSLGLHHTLCQSTVDYAGRSARLSRQQTVQQRVGQMQANYRTARKVVHHAAWALDRGEDCDADLFAAKLLAIQLAQHSARLATEIFSAHALRATATIDRLSRDIHCLWSPAGTADVQRYRLWQTATGNAKSSWSQRFGRT